MFIYPSPDRTTTPETCQSVELDLRLKPRFFLVLLNRKKVYFLHEGIRLSHDKTNISKLVWVVLGVKVLCSFFLEITEKECACALVVGAIASAAVVLMFLITH